jgi:hypothetical protein
MIAKQICPECKQLLIKSAINCFCGWLSSQVKTDHRCQYSIAQRRCPLPGTLCSYPYGHGTWYCQGHLQAFSDPKSAEAVLIDAEKNYQQILENRRDWRRKLFDK